MSSRHSTPLEIERINLIASQSTATPSVASLPNAFERLGQAQPVASPTSQRDRCTRLPVEYNDNYNPYKPLNLEKPIEYTPYASGEPLFDDRPIHVPSLRRHYTVASASV
jgi:hypothetical protein